MVSSGGDRMPSGGGLRYCRDRAPLFEPAVPRSVPYAHTLYISLAVYLERAIGMVLSQKFRNRKCKYQAYKSVCHLMFLRHFFFLLLRRNISFLASFFLRPIFPSRPPKVANTINPTECCLI